MNMTPSMKSTPWLWHACTRTKAQCSSLDLGLETIYDTPRQLSRSSSIKIKKMFIIVLPRQNTHSEYRINISVSLQKATCNTGKVATKLSYIRSNSMQSGARNRLYKPKLTADAGTCAEGACVRLCVHRRFQLL